ncbi:NUDIX hydrolase [Sinanaerobacter chloroacetimidivorans]|uniref:CoA pyrophosphatase n=1 Tax=Sinanaerobacter chloroacetimidivorans TaxID=2818044 RepID=A0A8J7W1B4_9FIRM|nr:CoA pyrophosphatase [Sinanaerobacter chloroacetimidivorans]MBR0598994.1 CoA pyrophosphatase [Sinanaerobacter chloroacetimidivorans]
MKKLTLNDFEEKFKGRTPKTLGVYRYYSVLVPLVEKNGELYLLYEVRSDSLKKQPGEVCFPGGKVEPDESPEECAIRETSEELNISPQEIQIIAQLDYMHTYSNFTMYSYLGMINYEVVKNMCVNQDEVKEVFLVPVSFLAENEPEIYNFDVIPDVGEDFPYDKINSKTGYNWRKGKSVVPIYEYRGRAIWGLTGRITYNLMNIVTEK